MAVPSNGLIALFAFVGLAVTFNFLYAFVLPLPFVFNPLFFVTSSHDLVRKLSVWAWWGVLIPLHLVEAVYCIALVRRSTAKAVQQTGGVLVLLTVVFGAPAIKLLREMEADEKANKAR